MWPSLETIPKTITIAGIFVFITLGTLNRPDLHFADAGNGPVVITWIGREHELFSGASPISLVEHCVTFRHENEGVHCFPRSSSINGASPSDYLWLYPGNSLRAGITPLQRCSRCIIQPQPTRLIILFTLSRLYLTGTTYSMIVYFGGV